MKKEMHVLHWVALINFTSLGEVSTPLIMTSDERNVCRLFAARLCTVINLAERASLFHNPSWLPIRSRETRQRLVKSF